VVTLGGLDLRSQLSRMLSVTVEAGAGAVPPPQHHSEAGQAVSGISGWALTLGGGVDVAF
jgi:hypothetical protein